MSLSPWHTRALLLTLSIWFPGLGRAQDVADQARNWFLTDYAPLWENLDAADPDKIGAFWAERFLDHPTDMDPGIWENTRETWQRVIDRSIADGLHGSTVVALQVEAISGRAVLIRTIWSDRGRDGPINEPACGTFIAGKFDGGWKFTNYFTVACSRE